MQTTVVNLKTSQYDVYIGRAGKGQKGTFGNPFPLSAGETRGSTIERFKKYFLQRLENDPAFKAEVLKLKGKRLGCFCKPHDCHGDVIAEYLNSIGDSDA